MKHWDVSGVDPTKPSNDYGRMVAEIIDATDIAMAVFKFCKRYPHTTQLSIIEAANDAEKTGSEVQSG